MSFWDNVKKFAQPYADDEYDEYDEEEVTAGVEEEQEEERPARRRAPAFNFSGNDTAATTPAASTGFSGNGGQMQNSIGGTSQSHIHRQRIVKCLCSHDVTGTQIIFQKFQDTHSRLFGKVSSLRIHGRNRAISRQSHADRFAEAIHTVGGKHSGTRTASGAS